MDYEEVQLAGDGELFIKSPYVTWKPEDTRVVSYVLWRPHPVDPKFGPDEPKLRQGWRMAPTARAARFEVTKQFGQILEENAAGDNVFFRVYKEHK